MKAKYRKKQPKKEDLRFYKEICINCGKERIKSWPKALPIPNMSEYWGKGNWVGCHLLNDHLFYAEQELEKNEP